MIAPIGSYARRAHRTLRTLITDPRTRLAAKLLGSAATGFLLSAASLSHMPMPIAMGFVCSLHGLPGLSAAAGATLGYWLFWGDPGFQGMVWTGLAMAVVLVFTRWPAPQGIPFLTEAIASVIVAGTGLAFQSFLGDTTPVTVYLLRVVLGALSTALFTGVLTRKNTVNHTLAEGVAVLALAQVAPVPYVSLGFLTAGLIGCWESFPGAALAGLALDLAQVTPVPMTAVLCLVYLVRMSPRGGSLLRYLAPGAVYLLVMVLCGQTDLLPVPCFAVGGLLARLLPERPEVTVRRGQTGTAQVRLELAANVLTETRQLLLETTVSPIDEEALVARAKERACGTCPCRKACRQRKESIPAQLLRRPLVDASALPFLCRKSGRLLSELRRSQEQLRAIKADRDRQGEYRSAVNQQYQFLSAFLRQLADQLPRRVDNKRQRYRVDVTTRSHSREAANGDKCLSFPGTGNYYYVLLCDGMGTGMGAAQDAQTATGLLRRLLSPEKPPQSVRPPGSGGGGDGRLGGNLPVHRQSDPLQMGRRPLLAAQRRRDRKNRDSHATAGAVRGGRTGIGGAAVPSTGRNADPLQRRRERRHGPSQPSRNGRAAVWGIGGSLAYKSQREVGRRCHGCRDPAAACVLVNIIPQDL